MPTLLESVKDGDDVRRVAVIKTITEASPILRFIPFTEIKGNSYSYDIEKSLPTVAFRGVREGYTPNEGVIETVTERLTIIGGEVKVDNFEVNTMGNIRDIKRRQFDMKARAMGIAFSETFFEGDSTIDRKQFDGIRKRISSDQTVNAATGGATLTLDMLDELIDKVVGDGDKHLFMNKTLRRKVTSLARAAGESVLVWQGADQLGRQVMTYNNVPIHVIERDDNEDTLLDFDEDDGSANLDTASIYCVRFGDEYVGGLRGAGSSLTVKDFGELEASPEHMGRIEAYWTICMKHPRSAARLVHINNA